MSLYPRNMQRSGVFQQLYHHGLCAGWTNTSPSDACKLTAARSREEMLLYAKRKSSTPLCSCIFIALQTQSSFAPYQHQGFFWPSASWASFIASPSRLFSGLELSCYSSKSCLVSPWYFLLGSVSHLLPARRILRCRWGLAHPLGIIRTPKPGAEGAARGCRAEASPAGTGEGEGVRDNPLFLQVSPAQAATSWAPTGTGVFLETATPKCKELVTDNILRWWSKETATLRVPGLGKLQKCRDDKVVQLLTWLVGQVFHKNKSSNR